MPEVQKEPNKVKQPPNTPTSKWKKKTNWAPVAGVAAGLGVLGASMYATHRMNSWGRNFGKDFRERVNRGFEDSWGRNFGKDFRERVNRGFEEGRRRAEQGRSRRGPTPGGGREGTYSPHSSSDIHQARQHLGIDPEKMSKEQMQTHFRNLAKKDHPDLYPEGPEREAANKRMSMHNMHINTLRKAGLTKGASLLESACSYLGKY